MLAELDLLQGRADARDEAGLTEGRLDAELEQEVTIQTGHPGRRIGQIEDEIAIEVETGREGPHRGRLARTNIPGDQTDTALPDEIGQAGAQFLLAGGGE